MKHKVECRRPSARKVADKWIVNSTANTAVSIKRKEVQVRQPLSSPLDQQISQINLEHLKLFHHFEHHTSETFIMDSQLWKKSLLCMALEVWILDCSHFYCHKLTEIRISSSCMPSFSRLHRTCAIWSRTIAGIAE